MTAKTKLDFRDQLHEDAKQAVAKNLANHTVHQIHDDGAPGRIWRCTNNGSSVYGFTVHAPPSWLMITGDMGECMWSREYDMLPWVRSSINSLDYFSSKASRDCDIKESRTELIEEWFKTVKKDWKEYGREWGTKQTEALNSIKNVFKWNNDPHRFMQELYESELCMDCDDLPDLKCYKYHYLWKVEALKWFIAKHDAGEVVKRDKLFSWDK